jgi:hypothetical protein
MARISPTGNSRRLRREARTVELMIRMYCGDNHVQEGGDGEIETPGPGQRPTPAEKRSALCPECATLLAYSLERIDACRFGENKPTCARCAVHCFRPVMREQIRAAMRYSGPRMGYRHPYLAARHIMDRRREPGEGD